MLFIHAVEWFAGFGLDSNQSFLQWYMMQICHKQTEIK